MRGLNPSIILSSLKLTFSPTTSLDCLGVFRDGVVLGGTQIDASDARRVVAVAKEIPHPSYLTVTPFYNDIMLVKLSSRVTGLPFQSLSLDNSSPLAGQVVKAVSSALCVLPENECSCRCDNSWDMAQYPKVALCRSIYEKSIWMSRILRDAMHSGQALYSKACSSVYVS
jgi:hypothetical protein